MQVAERKGKGCGGLGELFAASASCGADGPGNATVLTYHSQQHASRPTIVADTPFQRTMDEQSGSAHFEALWVSALQAYEIKMGVALAQHPLALALDLQTSRFTDNIATLLQCRAQAFDDRQRDRMMRTIKTTV